MREKTRPLLIILGLFILFVGYDQIQENLRIQRNEDIISHPDEIVADTIVTDDLDILKDETNEPIDDGKEVEWDSTNEYTDSNQRGLFYVLGLPKLGEIWNEFFSYYPLSTEPFVLFGTSHVYALLSIALTILIMTILSNRNQFIKDNYKKTMFYVIVIQELIFKYWGGINNHIDFEVIFSLHLCSLAIFLIVYLYYNFKQSIFELLYFWGLGGATQALITPDIFVYGFPHFRFFQVFLSHGLIVAFVFYYLLVENKTIRKGSLKRAFITTHKVALVVFIFNFIFGSNYMFLNHKPTTASILDQFGAWPQYIIGLEILLLIVFTLVYLPYIYKYYIKKKITTHNDLN